MRTYATGGNRVVALMVHGINTDNPEVSVMGRIDTFFNAYGVDTHLLNYGWTGVVGPVVKNPAVALKLIELLENLSKLYEEIWLLGHSNGAAIIHLLGSTYGARLPKNLTKIATVAPALEAELTPCPGFEGETYIFYNRYDRIGRLAQLANDLSPDCVDAVRPWGRMACDGYVGADPRIRQFDIQDKDWPHVVVGIKASLYGTAIVRIMSGHITEIGG